MTAHHQFFGRFSRHLVVGGLIVLVIGLAVLWSNPALAQTTTPPASVQFSIFNSILSPIVQAMIELFGKLTAYIVGLLVLVAQVNNFINSTPVTTGYPIVRDLANMVFIIALLIIAAGTILRLENYRYNRLLGRLIVMAFLVNLARFITGFFIQTSQVFLLTFVSAFKDIALGNFAYMFGLDAVLNFTRTSLTNPPSGQDIAIFATLVGGLAMMIVAFSVTLALVVMLLVRIVALWVLTILSPLAYALRIIPNTERYASTWWSEFGKYVVSGPVLAFFLWLALAISAAGSCNNTTVCSSQSNVIFQGSDQAIKNVADQTDTQLGTLRNTFVTEIFDPGRMLTFLVSIIFLVMGMQYASKSGTIGANFAKRVYEGGLARGATLTGLNAIRNQINDRAVAPIQGFLRQRDERRKAAVAERTQALGARVDQGLSATVGQVGRARTAATSAVATAARGGVQVLRGQQTVQEALSGAGEAGRRGFQLGTRATQQAAGRIEDWKQRKVNIRGQEVDITSPRVDIPTLRDLAQNVDGAVRTAAIAELVRRSVLDKDKAEDVRLVQRAGTFLGDREAGQKFMGQVEGVDPQLARKAYFGDIRDAATQAKIKDAIESRAVSTKIFNKDDLEYITSNPELARDVSTFIVNTARNADEMKKFFAGINEDYRNSLFKHLDMTGKQYEDRKIVAETTGQVGRAFRDGTQLLTNDLSKFVQYRGKKLSDIISTASAEDSEMLQAIQMNKDSSLTEKELTEIADKSDFHRKALLAALNGRPTGPEGPAVQGLYDRLKSENKGKATYTRGESGYEEQEKTRRAIFKVSRGEKLAHDIGEGDAFKEANDNFTKLAKSLKAADARRLGSNEQYADPAKKKIILTALGKKMNVRELGELAGAGTEQFGIAQQAVQTAYDAGKNADTKSPEYIRARELARNENTNDLIERE